MMALQESPTQTTQALSKVFGVINKLEKVEGDIIALLPGMTDDEVLDTRVQAKTLGRSAWRIEIACDAELWNRTYARRGRGNVDTEGVGVKATVAKRAAELGCSSRTIESNAKVYKLVQEVEQENSANTCTILDEKGYWQAADASDDPKAAIEHFIEEKLSNPMYSVTDAFRWSKGRKESKERIKKMESGEMEMLYTPEAQALLAEYMELLTKFEERTTVPHLRVMFQSHKAHAHWQKKRNIEDDCAVIVRIVKKTGDGERGDIAAHDLYERMLDFGYFMGQGEFNKRLEYMNRDDVRLALLTDAGDGKQDDRRGKLPGIVCVPWRKVWDQKSKRPRDDDEKDDAA